MRFLGAAEKERLTPAAKIRRQACAITETPTDWIKTLSDSVRRQAGEPNRIVPQRGHAAGAAESSERSMYESVLLCCNPTDQNVDCTQHQHHQHHHRITAGDAHSAQRSEQTQTDPRDAPHHVHRVARKADAECDQQATVVGRLFTALTVSTCRGERKSRVWGNAPERNILNFGELRNLFETPCMG